MERVKKWWTNIMIFVGKIAEDHVGAYAGQSSFFMIMGVIPFFMLFLGVLKYTRVTDEILLTNVMYVIPDAFEYYARKLIESVYTQSSAMLPVTAVTALWISGKAMLSITKGLNSIYDVLETRNYIWMRLRSSFYTLLLLIALTVSAVLLVFGNDVHALIIRRFPLVENLTSVIAGIRAATIAFLSLIFTCMYTLLPNKKKKFSHQIPGAVATAVSWSIYSYFFSIYTEVAKNMSVLYGSLAALVMIMLWLYFGMYLFFLGAELNYFLEEEDIWDLTEQQDVLK